ncbi:hypothetical protein V1511DRAFT_508862 [Dipodascopsis uninucleata]
MSKFLVSKEKYDTFVNKVVVITGGSMGIGASIVQILLEMGNYVVFGDIMVEVSELLVKELLARNRTYEDKLLFVKTDISKYDDIYKLFYTALEKYGRVDTAINVAGLPETENWLEPDFTVKSVKSYPSTTKVVDVNFMGSLYFVRIAPAFLKHEKLSSEDKNMILFSSVAGFKESPGICVYQATKHAVIGILRATRKYTPISDYIRINVICPWMTLTRMVEGIKDGWIKNKLPTSMPSEVANITIGVAAEGTVSGECIFISRATGWMTESGIDTTEHIWLGVEPSRELARGQAFLGSGLDWTKNK